MRNLKSFVMALAMVGLFGSALVACGDDTTTSDDLTIIKDMSAGMTGCSGIATCILTTCSGDSACITSCVGKGTSGGQAKYQALAGCGLTVCTMATDAGAAKCASVTDTSAACVTCAQAAAQSAACSTQLNACLADK